MAGTSHFKASMLVTNQIASLLGGAAVNFPHELAVDRRRGSDTSPVVDTPVVIVATLAAGTLTIDLTALTGLNGAAIDLTGQVVYDYAIYNTGSNNMTIDQSDTNGYGLFTTGGTEIKAGGFIFGGGAATGYGTVGASAKDLVLTGTGTEVAHIILSTGVEPA